KKLNNKIRKFEKEIDALEKDLKEIDFNLADPGKFKELSKNSEFFTNYEQKQLKLKETEQFWETANLELDALKY
ncbi:MAG: ABC transporter ATP-binding protein, partial [Flavobacteriales bacterium]|nr:ABC transporter ATP-binding protein [Flavobacteriales bacterium]